MCLLAVVEVVGRQQQITTGQKPLRSQTFSHDSFKQRPENCFVWWKRGEVNGRGLISVLPRSGSQRPKANSPGPRRPWDWAGQAVPQARHP
ncbi:Uncharacterized protein HZ326_20776 [Fusarium oxysporum f. sp. albedinis]|nr:Uncharacterized protein HZ326_20776 [Fusarium oxysporum f. sp. albedinis]